MRLIYTFFRYMIPLKYSAVTAPHGVQSGICFFLYRRANQKIPLYIPEIIIPFFRYYCKCVSGLQSTLEKKYGVWYNEEGHDRIFTKRGATDEMLYFKARANI